MATPSAPAGAPKRKLIFGYWNVRGFHRANPCCYLLNYANVDYDTSTYQITENSWFEVKSGTGIPFPNLPYIIDGDFKLSESMAVAQYICGKFKPELLGTTPQEKARIYQLQNIVAEISSESIKPFYAHDDRNAHIANYTKQVELLVTYLASKTYLIGDNLTLPDFLFFEVINYAVKLSDSAILTTYPTLQAYHDRIKNLPGLKEYLESDKA